MGHPSVLSGREWATRPFKARKIGDEEQPENHARACYELDETGYGDLNPRVAENMGHCSAGWTECGGGSK